MSMGESWTGIFDEPNKGETEEKHPWKNLLQDPPQEDQAGVESKELEPTKIDWGHLLDSSAASPPHKNLDWSDLSFEDAQSVIQERELMEPYLAIMPDYYFHGIPEHTEFLNDNPNIGYKLHLNVVPENVRAVSDFLQQQGYEHKFLHGGEVGDGKIFTVYTGSAEHTQQVVKEITDAINDILEEPKAFGEVKYAPKICGRFTGSVQFFRQYGHDGIALLNDLAGDDPINTPERAKAKAQELYPGYFQSELEQYVPEEK